MAVPWVCCTSESFRALRTKELARSARSRIERDLDRGDLAGSAKEQGQAAVDLHDDAAAVQNRVVYLQSIGILSETCVEHVVFDHPLIIAG